MEPVSKLHCQNLFTCAHCHHPAPCTPAVRCANKMKRNGCRDRVMLSQTSLRPVPRNRLPLALRKGNRRTNALLLIFLYQGMTMPRQPVDAHWKNRNRNQPQLHVGSPQHSPQKVSLKICDLAQRLHERATVQVENHCHKVHRFAMKSTW